MRKAIDIIGKKYGRLTVIGNETGRSSVVVCRCDCGKTVKKNKNNVMRGMTRSCGCLKKEVGSATASKVFENNRAMSRRYNTNFNIIESSKIRKDNTTGVKGVSYDKANGVYLAYVYMGGKRKDVCRSKSLAVAAKARKEAEEIYYKPLIDAKREELESGVYK